MGLTLLFVAVLMTSASPRIRSGRDPKEPDVDTRRNFVSCFQTIPCGWALYTTERRQPFRRISTYTRNRLCDCDQDSHCVLTDNSRQQSLCFSLSNGTVQVTCFP